VHTCISNADAVALQCAGLLSSFQITRCGASHWEDRALLQRVYGVSFPSNGMLKQWQHLQEEAKKRDHRVIGKNQQLFMFHQLSPGSCFFLPHGTRVFNTLANFIRDEYRRRGYDEVITPLIFKKQLWETSGHLKNYHEDMFMVSQGISDASECEHEDDGHKHDHHHHAADEGEVDEFGLKPMNCPGHCLLFRESRRYSYRECGASTRMTRTFSARATRCSARSPSASPSSSTCTACSGLRSSCACRRDRRTTWAS